MKIRFLTNSQIQTEQQLMRLLTQVIFTRESEQRINQKDAILSTMFIVRGVFVA
jgi:hypothetical protein